MSATNNVINDVPGVTCSTRDGVEIIEIDNQHAKAQLTTYGATLLSFIPNNQQDLLWVSESAVYDGSKPVRGGIPICWPWFGKAKQSGLPAHGFVRNLVWTVEKASQLDTGETRILLGCSSSEETLAIWPYEFKLELCVEVGQDLTLNLTSKNLSNQTMPITEALHTYFNVSDPNGLPIDGLQQSRHFNTLLENPSEQTPVEKLILQPSHDSVYLNQTGKVVIDDSAKNRKIMINKRNSKSTIVWNPGPEIVKGFADINDQAWLDFACVESGNVWDDSIELKPQTEHTLSVQYSVKSV